MNDTVNQNKPEDGKRERFLRIYANLPIGVRNEIILSLKDKGPITWLVAYVEINNHTELGEKILNSLEELKII